MKARILGILLLAAGLPLAFAVGATEIQIGNVAPGSGEIELIVDGARLTPRLGYLDFANATLASGPMQVQAVRNDTGAIVAQAMLKLEPAAGIQPLLVLAGNGSVHAYSLRLYQKEGDEDSAMGKAISATSVAGHHLAPYAGSSNDATIVPNIRCSASIPGIGTEVSEFSIGGSITGYGAVTLTRFDTLPDATLCKLQVAHPVFGSFELKAQPENDKTLRLILVGDGILEPFQLIAAQAGVVVAAAGSLAPAPIAITQSEDFWFDSERPTQSITLYELSGGQQTFGLWFSHDLSGRPVWYLINGIPSSLPGRRELKVFQSSRISESTLVPVGSAQLFYLDCNQAEMRIAMNDGSFRTLRLRRSREVAVCAAFD